MLHVLANITAIYSPLWLFVPAAVLLGSLVLWCRTRSVSTSLQAIGAFAFLVWALHSTVFVLIVEGAGSIQRSEEISFWIAVTMFPAGFLWYALQRRERI
jgi:hypothetical protein